MKRHTVYREGRYMPIGSVQAPTHEAALVLAEVMYGGDLMVQRDALFPVPRESWADADEREHVGLTLIMRQIRRVE